MQITTKQQQREFYKALRKSIDAEEKLLRDKKIFDLFFEKIITENIDKHFLMYVSNGFEIDTVCAIKKMLEMNIKVSVPKCEKGTNIMHFYTITSLDDLASGYFGISEPKEYCEKLCYFDDAICVVPGICFDKNGYRIGYGKGFYDRFLVENSGILTIGFCYEKFIIDSIFYDANDVSVDFLLTEKKLLKL